LLSGSATTWLNLANGALGLAVVLCGALILASVVYEFTIRVRSRAHIIRNADAAVRALLHGHTGGRGSKG
jgi:hypothetical protein